MMNSQLGIYKNISHLDKTYVEPILEALMAASYKILNSRPAGLQTKPDGTLVGETDIANERSIIQIIQNAFPGARIVAEETQNAVPAHWDQGTIFFVDPLDGTRSNAFGQPFSTAGISVYKDGKPYFSGMVHPYEGYALLTQVGEGTWKVPVHQERIPSRTQIVNNDKGVMAYIDGHYSVKNTERKLNVLQLLQEGYGTFALRSVGSNIAQQAAVAIGQGNLTLTDAVGGFFDLAGALPIQEAGGVFIDAQTGLPVTPDTHIAIGGHPDIIKTLQDEVALIYDGYTGFR